MVAAAAQVDDREAALVAARTTLRLALDLTIMLKNGLLSTARKARA